MFMACDCYQSTVGVEYVADIHIPAVYVPSWGGICCRYSYSRCVCVQLGWHMLQIFIFPLCMCLVRVEYVADIHIPAVYVPSWGGICCRYSYSCCARAWRVLSAVASGSRWSVTGSRSTCRGSTSSRARRCTVAAWTRA